MSEDGQETQSFDGQADEVAPTAPDASQPEGRRSTSAAHGARRHLAAGYAAMRDVHEVSRRRSSAKSEAKALRAELAADEKTLARRLEIEREFEGIVAEQERALEAARADERMAQEEASRLASERATLEAQLSALKSRHEEELRPYRKLADAAKGRSDDASVALAEARRAVRSADGRMAEAVRNRDQRVQQANRALDSAQGRLHKAQSELDRLQADDEAAPALVERMRGEVAVESTAIEAAKNDVGQASDAAQLAVETAQTHLWTQRQSLEVAERQAASAKAEAKSRREEYDALYRKAKEEEDEITSWIRERGRGVERARAAAKEAHERAETAQGLLDEAWDVHATPGQTQALGERVAAAHGELERRDEGLARLARQEQVLRRRTRSTRMAFLAVVIVGVLLVVVLVWAVVLRQG